MDKYNEARIEALLAQIKKLESRIAYLEANIEVSNTKINNDYYENE